MQKILKIAPNLHIFPIKSRPLLRMSKKIRTFVAEKEKDNMLNSLVKIENTFHSTDQIHQWILRRNQEVSVSVEEIPFAKMQGWGGAKMVVCIINQVNSFLLREFM